MVPPRATAQLSRVPVTTPFTTPGARHSSSGPRLGGPALKGQVIVEIVLVAVLAAYGRQLVNRMPASPWSEIQQAVSTNERLLYTAAPGIDVRGQTVDLARGTSANRIAAFVLRTSNLAQDLGTWREVAGALPKESGIALVGYCDGSACAERVRINANPLPFPVIAYGEVVDLQAMLNADAAGALLFCENPGAEKRAAEKHMARVSRRIAWRGARPVAAIVRSLTQ